MQLTVKPFGDISDLKHLAHLDSMVHVLNMRNRAPDFWGPLRPSPRPAAVNKP
jgi:hypothetical protein